MRRLLEIMFCWYWFCSTTNWCVFLCEVLGGCDNSNPPLSGNRNNFDIFCGLLLDGPFLFWVLFVFFFPQFFSRLTFAKFISACSVVEFAFSFEISVLSTFNLTTFGMTTYIKWSESNTWLTEACYYLPIYTGVILYRDWHSSVFLVMAVVYVGAIWTSSYSAFLVEQSHLDQQLFCLSCWVVFDASLCISSVMVSGTKLKYMCGTTTAEADLSSQLFLELMPLFPGIFI